MITKLAIENFKSIQRQEVELDRINILIGPNGAGKSNFVEVFHFLERLSEQQLQQYIFQSGGVNALLFRGFKKHPNLRILVEFAKEKDPALRGIYEIRLLSNGEEMRVEHERLRFFDANAIKQAEENQVKYPAALETRLKNFSEWRKENNLAHHFYRYFKDLKVFHFHDTSDNAPVKLAQPIDDIYFLKADAGNLAPLLLHFREQYPETYRRIVQVVGLVYPLFHDFELAESPRAKDHVALRWREKGNDQVFTAKQISDGTLRFICLATLLIQPPDSAYVPNTIVLDEPELGLHPFAIEVLGELIQKTSLEKQLIVATQSVGLINYFQPEQLLITERAENGATQLRRLKDKDFAAWLEDYSLGQLWENNMLGGKP